MIDQVKSASESSTRWISIPQVPGVAGSKGIRSQLDPPIRTTRLISLEYHPLSSSEMFDLPVQGALSLQRRCTGLVR